MGITAIHGSPGWSEPVWWLSKGTWAAGLPCLILFGKGVQAAKKNLLVPAKEEEIKRGLSKCCSGDL